MARIEIANFESTLSQVFHGGERLCRELRLTDEEAGYLRRAYPHACIKPLSGPVGGKAWYQVQVASATA